jgi:hypothetical protein
VGSAEIFRTVLRQSVAGSAIVTLDRPHPFQAGDVVFINGLGDANFNGTPVLTAVAQLTVTYPTVAPPSPPIPDIGGLVSLPPEDRNPILPRSYEYIRGYGKGAVAGLPLFYSDYDYYHFIVSPVPDRPCPFELNYYQIPPMLDVTNQTNWLTDIAPNLLLYASLQEMAPFLKNAEMTQTWQQLYERAGQAITGQDLDKINDRTSERTKP